MSERLLNPAFPTSAAGAKPLIGITMGDPAGIGAETIIKALADPDLRALGRFIIYGVDEILSAAADDSAIAPFWFSVRHGNPIRVGSGVVVVDYNEYDAGYWISARPTADGGAASLRFVDHAIEAARIGTIDAMVTGPINKVSWGLADCRFPGHTEKIADAFKVKRYNMAFVGGGLRVVLASTHVGLFELCSVFNLGMVFQAIDLLYDALTQWFGLEDPRIAVAGLNPHAGEAGRFGDEEERVIRPAMQMARNNGIHVEGPFPSDTMFTPSNRSRYDGIVAMYHDQGLIPIKMLAFDTAVNVTLGLPIIRTSADHGTAFDIAGTNRADCGSMKEAIRLACELASQKPKVQWSPSPAGISAMGENHG